MTIPTIVLRYGHALSRRDHELMEPALKAAGIDLVIEAPGEPTVLMTAPGVTAEDLKRAQEWATWERHETGSRAHPPA